MNKTKQHLKRLLMLLIGISSLSIVAYDFNQVHTPLSLSENTIEKKLVISTDTNNDIVTGSLVRFTVLDDQQQIVKGAKILVNNTVVSNPWVATSGTVDIKAIKEGYLPSEDLQLYILSETYAIGSLH
ncbi:hypothetical protein [Myroides pelagicus]|uniref:Carboxypeptidase regulatory-like domain-containing protein n=1 Tax=Myroides pelagicus TaxID=270914 RepID=A0A7K1GPK1_9FLAO|nr:hypothetical protein [Myroides pelagicus]MTH30776.1 hypothetical protein [Myroides pelagicus]